MFDLDKAINCSKKMKIYFSEIIQDANVEIPENIKKGTNEHILYIFYSCLLDYGMRSKIYHANLIDAYQKHKEIFSPKYVIDHFSEDSLELLDIIKNHIHPRYPNVAVKKWISLSKFLNDNFADEELKEKICSLKSYKELYHFITNINGYGQKTGGLLLRLIYEAGICHFNDDIEDIPIDRHDIEISYLNGIVKKEKLNQEELKQLGKIWIQAGRKNNISPCDMDKYLWSIGNNLCSKKECKGCPLNIDCIGKA